MQIHSLVPRESIEERNAIGRNDLRQNDQRASRSALPVNSRQGFCLLCQREPLQNRVPCRGAKIPAARFVAKQHRQRQRQFLFVVRTNQKAVGTMLDDFGNSLSATANDWLARGHSLKVNAAQAFVSTRQGEYCAASHRRGNLTPRLASEESHTIGNFQFPSQGFKATAFRTLADDLQGKRRKLGQRATPPRE